MGMKSEGWTLSDLQGELSARGMEMPDDISMYLDCEKPEYVASEILRRGE